jgi:hypothetical protein
MLVAGMVQILFVGYSIPMLSRQKPLQPEPSLQQTEALAQPTSDVVVLVPDPLPQVLRGAEAWSQATHTCVARGLLKGNQHLE